MDDRNPHVIAIRRCPSWSKVSGLLGEWNAYQRGRVPMSPDRAAMIAGELMAVVYAKRQGRPMPKDWGRCHPSLPYQMQKHVDAILECDLIRMANELPEIDIFESSLAEAV